MSRTVRTSLLARAIEREVADAIDVRGREMRAGDQQRLALRDEGLVDIGLGDRHVGAVLAQEDQRERVLVLDAQHHRAGQPRRIDADVADVAAFARDRLDQETAQRVVADARDQCGLEAQSRAAERGVGRRAAQILGEAGDILEPRADLLRVEVDGEAAEADDVEPAVGGERRGVSHRQARSAAETERDIGEMRGCKVRR